MQTPPPHISAPRTPVKSPVSITHQVIIEQLVLNFEQGFSLPT